METTIDYQKQIDVLVKNLQDFQPDVSYIRITPLDIILVYTDGAEMLRQEFKYDTPTYQWFEMFEYYVSELEDLTDTVMEKTIWVQK